MKDKLLIELVKAHTFLYDLADPKYMDSGLKMRVWNEIGQKMEAEGERCKARWNNIRDNYKKSLKKLKTTSKRVKRYRFADQLSFMTKYLDERDTKGNIRLATDDCESENDQEQESENTAEQPQPQSQQQQLVRQDVNITDVPTANNSANKTDSSAFSTPRRSGTKRKVQHEPASSLLLKYFLEKHSGQEATTSNQVTANLQHPVDAFLFGISPMLKSFSPYYLSLAKSEIFATVHKYEMMMLTEQQGATSTQVSCQRAFQPLAALANNESTESPSSSSSCSDMNSTEDNRNFDRILVKSELNNMTTS
ncbi:uncharacterized protein [Periplaneta americana]|uniref:uncharacterized protein n=1 Tax=Periplaneta americana TaxID=6978 RepID=UPI0037E97AEE